MSREALHRFLTDLRDQPGLSQQAGSDSSVMEGYDLSVEEREALLAGDRERLEEYGVHGDLLAVAGDVARPGGKT